MEGAQVYVSELELDEGSIVQFGVTAVAYITPEGAFGYRFSVSEPVSATSLAGLLELVKTRVLLESLGG